MTEDKKCPVCKSKREHELMRLNRTHRIAIDSLEQIELLETDIVTMAEERKGLREKIEKLEVINRRWQKISKEGGEQIKRLKKAYNRAGDAFEEEANKRIELEEENERLKAVVFETINAVVLGQCGWESDEDIVTFNGKPIGCTISKHSKEFNRWYESFKGELIKEISKALNDSTHESKEGE